MSTQQQTNEAYPVPLGSVYYFASTFGARGGFLLADGSAISRADYWELFEYIGTGYGVGDGATTFNLPDLMTYPYIRGVATQTYIAPTSGGGSGSSGFTIPVGALPSLANTDFTNNLTFSATTSPQNHLSFANSRTFDVGLLGTRIILNNSDTGTNANVSMSALTVSYSNPTPTQVSITAGGSGLVIGSTQMVAYIKAFTNVGNQPRPKAFSNPIEPPSGSFNAPYQNVPSLSGLVLG
jgi:microcystin-dependent protein